MNSKKTSNTIASQASKTLRDPNSSEIAKSLAASALSQSNSKKQTGKELETKATKLNRTCAKNWH